MSPAVRPGGGRIRVDQDRRDPTPSSPPDVEHGDVADSVLAVSHALGRVRETLSELGFATILADMRDVPAGDVCSILDDLTANLEDAISILSNL
jgi:hypothetical protein